MRAMFRNLTALALVMSAGAVHATDLTTMSEAERDAFRSEVRAYLMDNPEVLMEAIGVLESRQAEAEAAQDGDLVADNAKAIFESPNDLVVGNPDGDIVMVEFMDYRCGYCKKAYPDMNALLETDGNIKLIIKEFPILGEASLLASKFALATKFVAGDEAYDRIHSALMTHNGDITEGSLRRLAKKVDIDAEPVLAALDSDDVMTVIRENHALAQTLKINGTPTFVLDDQLLRGYVPFDTMQDIVAETRRDG